jgi:hypothetical protein
MDTDDQSIHLENEFIMTNLKVYLEQPLYNVNKDGFIKIQDLKVALQSLKCDSVSEDDIESLVSVVIQIIFDTRVEKLSEYSKINGITEFDDEVSDKLLKIEDIITCFKQL